MVALEVAGTVEVAQEAVYIVLVGVAVWHVQEGNLEEDSGIDIDRVVELKSHSNYMNPPSVDVNLEEQRMEHHLRFQNASSTLSSKKEIQSSGSD